jgi:hypothetical protein
LLRARHAQANLPTNSQAARPAGIVNRSGRSKTRLDRTRDTAFSRVVQCCADMGGMTREIPNRPRPAFCIGRSSDGRAILAPEWVDRAALLSVVPRACKPYRAKTKEAMSAGLRMG